MILPFSCLFVSAVAPYVANCSFAASERSVRKKILMTVKSTYYEEKKLLASTEEIRAALAKRIIRLIGKSKDQTTAIPGFAIYRRDHPTGPIFGLYEPSLTLLVQGRKRVMLGQEAFACGPSRYLLTSVNVPVIGQVVEASPEWPYLCFFLKLDLGAARQLLIDGGKAEGQGALEDQEEAATSGKPAKADYTPKPKPAPAAQTHEAPAHHGGKLGDLAERVHSWHSRFGPRKAKA